MKLRGKTFKKIDNNITSWMAKNGLLLLRLSIGIIFFWYGILKFFKGLSPAEDLAVNTISTLSFGLIPDKIILYGLALVEVVIGVGLILKVFFRAILLLLFLQMLGTFIPIVLYPSEVFNIFPYSLTLEGQYIVKNIIIVSSAIVLWSTAKGGKLTTKAEN